LKRANESLDSAEKAAEVNRSIATTPISILSFDDPGLRDATAAVSGALAESVARDSSDELAEVAEHFALIAAKVGRVTKYVHVE
jgi:hypothetical protein